MSIGIVVLPPVLTVWSVHHCAGAVSTLRPITHLRVFFFAPGGQQEQELEGVWRPLGERGSLLRRWLGGRPPGPQLMDPQQGQIWAETLEPRAQREPLPTKLARGLPCAEAPAPSRVLLPTEKEAGCWGLESASLGVSC